MVVSRIVIFLIRRKLGLRKDQAFQFTNQKKKAIYWFTNTNLMKMEHNEVAPSSVSLNWLIDKECAVRPVE